jgi:hypothetical protein
MTLKESSKKGILVVSEGIHLQVSDWAKVLIRKPKVDIKTKTKYPNLNIFDPI